MRRPWLAGCVLAAGCLPSNYFPIQPTAEEDDSSDEEETGGPALPTTSGSTEPATGTTSTTDEEGTTVAETTEPSTGTTTTGEPLGPPTIIKVTFSPDPVTAAGPVGVVVETAHADAVGMAGPGDLMSALGEERPQKFVDPTAMAIVSSEANAEQHCATFTPWRDGVAGAEVVACFTVKLPPGGTETYWEGAPDKGKGSIAALATLPDGHVVEFGTYHQNNQSRCYLRLRDAGGAWKADDFVDLFETETCTATDMVATEKGELYLLANVTTNGDTRWWLGSMEGWKGATKKVGGGVAGATGRALAREKVAKRVAVCGTYPTQEMDVADAAVWLFEDGKQGLNKQFDHVPAAMTEHTFRETPFDCAFAGPMLVLTGEVRGRHPGEEVVRKRHFLLEYGPAWPEGHFTVAGAIKGIESGASALAIDKEGNYISVGFRCGEPCNEVPELRKFAPGGAQLAHTTLPSGLLTPFGLAYSPADYVVLATGTKPEPSLFVVQAWRVGENAPVWPYGHKGAPSSEIATALAIGPYGQVYAGGISADGYPAIAFIAP